MKKKVIYFRRRYKFRQLNASASPSEPGELSVVTLLQHKGFQ